MRFEPVAGPRMRTVRQYVADEGGDPAKIEPDIAELLFMGHLRGSDGYDADEIVLDGSTGRVFTMWLYMRSPGSARLFPLAPSLDALVRFVSAVCEFGSLRGRFAGLAGRCIGSPGVRQDACTEAELENPSLWAQQSAL
jgi:hypothetical protein